MQTDTFQIIHCFLPLYFCSHWIWQHIFENHFKARIAMSVSGDRIIFLTVWICSCSHSTMTNLPFDLIAPLIYIYFSLKKRSILQKYTVYISIYSRCLNKSTILGTFTPNKKRLLWASGKIELIITGSLIS